MGLFFLHLELQTYYITDDDVLIIKHPIFPWGMVKIDIKTIKKIKLKQKKHRIEIRYKKYDHIKISPKDKHLFIKHLTSVNQGIEVEGDANLILNHITN